MAAAALTLSSGVVRTTFALFNGETTNTAAFADGWVGAPSGATATASGYDMGLTWTAGTHGPVTGQQVLGVDNLTNPNCTGAAYSSIATLSASANSYSDPSRANATNDGDWFCYELVSTSATVWTSSLVVPVQIGLVANGLSTASGSSPNAVSKTDTITITFNQQTTLANQTGVTVCVYTSGAILIGDSSSKCAAATDTYSIGKLTLSGATLGSNVTFGSSSTLVSTSAPWTVKVTLAGSNSTSAITGTPTWTFTPNASIKSSATTHQATICSATKTTCQPTATTSF